MMHPELNRPAANAARSRQRLAGGTDRSGAHSPSEEKGGIGAPESTATPKVAQLQQLSRQMNASPRSRDTAQLRDAINRGGPQDDRAGARPEHRHPPVVQRVFSGDPSFQKLTRDEFLRQYYTQLDGLKYVDKVKIYSELALSPQAYTAEEIPDAIAARRPPGARPRLVDAAELSPQVNPAVGRDVPRNLEQPPEPLVKAVGKMVESAQPEILEEKKEAPELNILVPDDREARANDNASRAEDARAIAPARDDAAGVIVNYVWLGDRTLGSLEKFNINSWRALGHQVNIYAMRFDGKDATAETLGIDDREARVIDLRHQLGIDQEDRDPDSPRPKMEATRALLWDWIGAIPRRQAPTGEHIYNMVDLTKSYLGATQRGIVLDMKVGPSEHLPAYIDSFNTNFISYSRGEKTGGRVENQSMGTMQQSNALRNIYANTIENSIRMRYDGYREQPNQSWFNYITGFHQKAFDRIGKQAMDVARSKPDGRGDAFAVQEPGGWGHGPFRVFKAANDQTNQGPASTKIAEVRRIAGEVWSTQLREKASEDPEDPAIYFIHQAAAAKDNIGIG